MADLPGWVDWAPGVRDVRLESSVAGVLRIEESLAGALVPLFLGRAQHQAWLAACRTAAEGRG